MAAARPPRGEVVRLALGASHEGFASLDEFGVLLADVAPEDPVAIAMPEATPEERERMTTEAADGAGAAVALQLGHRKGAIDSTVLSAADAAKAVANLAAREADARDVARRGTEARPRAPKTPRIEGVRIPLFEASASPLEGVR